MNEETMFKIISHNHANKLISLSGTYLEQNESENNLPIGLAYRLAEDPYYYTSELPLLLSILGQGRVVGVAVMTPPKKIILSKIDTDIGAAVVCLVDYLRGIDVRIPGSEKTGVSCHKLGSLWYKRAACVSPKDVPDGQIAELLVVLSETGV